MGSGGRGRAQQRREGTLRFTSVFFTKGIGTPVTPERCGLGAGCVSQAATLLVHGELKTQSRNVQKDLSSA